MFAQRRKGERGKHAGCGAFLFSLLSFSPLVAVLEKKGTRKRGATTLRSSFPAPFSNSCSKGKEKEERKAKVAIASHRPFPPSAFPRLSRCHHPCRGKGEEGKILNPAFFSFIIPSLLIALSQSPKRGERGKDRLHFSFPSEHQATMESGRGRKRGGGRGPGCRPPLYSSLPFYAAASEPLLSR